MLYLNIQLYLNTQRSKFYLNLNSTHQTLGAIRIYILRCINFGTFYFISFYYQISIGKNAKLNALNFPDTNTIRYFTVLLDSEKRRRRFVWRQSHLSLKPQNQRPCQKCLDPSRLSIPQISSTTTVQKFVHCSPRKEVIPQTVHSSFEITSRELGISAAFSRANFKGDRASSEGVLAYMRACVRECVRGESGREVFADSLCRRFTERQNFPVLPITQPDGPVFGQPDTDRTKSKAKGTKPTGSDPSITGWCNSGARTRREKGPLDTVCVVARGHENRGFDRDWTTKPLTSPISLCVSIFLLSVFFLFSLSPSSRPQATCFTVRKFDCR